MEATQSQLPVVLPPLPKLRPRPGHLGATGRETTIPRPIIDTSPSTIEEKGSTVSKLLMKSEFSRLGDLQVQSANNSSSTRDCTVQRTTYILGTWLKNFLNWFLGLVTPKFGQNSHGRSETYYNYLAILGTSWSNWLQFGPEVIYFSDYL